MINIPAPTEIQLLLTTDNPEQIWAKAIDIIKAINPAFDFTLSRKAYDDVLNLFKGEYPGYRAIKTPYHNLNHTLDVFLCSVRLMHGVHLAVSPLADHEITWIMMATLMHDIGYAQRNEEGNSGTGAQHTLTHVGRGIGFMQHYVLEHNLPSAYAQPLEFLMNSTNPAIDFSSIVFPDERTKMLSQIVGSADIVGQMADRTYLEKLLFLYLEFKEAHFGNYASLHDLLRQTKDFYDATKGKKLDGTFAGIYKNLTAHFKQYMGLNRNLYLESIEKNIDYLSKVITLDENEYLMMLKRGGIVDKSQSLVMPSSIF
ncbi:MAG: hypothetical protein ACOH1I_04375 [Gallionellaceae bacterium]|jgi:hypothetical protein